jgi:hypothetical protein
MIVDGQVGACAPILRRLADGTPQEAGAASDRELGIDIELQRPGVQRVDVVWINRDVVPKALRRVSKPHVRSNNNHTGWCVRRLWAWATSSGTCYQICGYLSAGWDRCQKCDSGRAHDEFLQFHLSLLISIRFIDIAIF